MKIQKETAKLCSSICIVVSVLIILATCGTCCSGKTTYGPEEFYDRGDGTLGYGAKSYNSNTDQLALMLFAGIPIAVLLMIASAVFQALAEDDKTSITSKLLSNTAPSMKCPVCGNKCSIRAKSCPKCGHPL